MKLKKVRESAETVYRIDWPEKGWKHFYNEIFHSREKAQAYLDERNPKYKDKLVIVAEDLPERDAWVGSVKL